jgi:hypothetical protein
MRRLLPTGLLGPFRLCVVLLCTLAGISGPTQAWPEETGPGESPFFFRVDDLHRYFAWGTDLVPTGADVTFGYRGWRLFPGVDTILQTTVGGGYEGLETYRNIDYRPHFQIPTEAAAGHDRHLEFNSPIFAWELGLVQGILWNDRLARNWLEGFAFYRGRYERYLAGRYYHGTDPTRITSIEAYHDWWKQNYAGTDAEGIFGTSFLVGLDINAIEVDEVTTARRGYYAEASVEASPWFSSVLGATDFWRITLALAGFGVLHEARPAGNRPGLVIYIGDFFSIDYADAQRAMPTYVMQTFGGRTLRYGLGDDSVRGFEAHSWDTQLKIVNNVDLRFTLPSLLRSDRLPRDLVPGFLLFFDLGYGAGFWGDPSGTPGGILGSTGAGIYLHLFDVGSAVGYVSFPVIGSRLDGQPVALDLKFRLHF